MGHEEHPALHRFRRELPPGATVYEQGTVLPEFFVLISGRVVFEVLDALGARTTVGEVLAGGAFGLVSAFAGRPTSAAARTVSRTELLAVPVVEAVEAFGEVPELAVAIICQFAEERLAPPNAAPNIDEVAVEPEPLSLLPLNVLVDDEEQAAPVASEAPALGGFNELWFFTDDAQCPVCRNTFSYLRVRASAVRPAHRDTDFRIAYKTVDPSLYAVSVCPHCAYAAYVEDFNDVDAEERRALLASRAERQAQVAHPLVGERSVDDAVVSLRLALECARVRGSGPRRIAGLLHRLAWLERTRGDAEAERALLQDAHAEYVRVYEQDPDIQDASAMRVAYLIGDLALRLGEVESARRWLLECVNMKTAARQEGLLRMARERLDDARGAQGGLARSA